MTVGVLEGHSPNACLIKWGAPANKIFTDKCVVQSLSISRASCYLSEVLLFICGSEVPYNKALLARYHKALDRAVQLATVHNVQPIPGTTVILCDLRPAMKQPCTSAKGLGKPRTVSSALTLPVASG